MIQNNYISRELFIESIEAIHKQYIHDKKCTAAFKVILPNDYTSNYDNHYLQNQLIKLLQVAFNDEHKDSWIEYFCWELDFGKKFIMGMVTDNGKDVDLSDAGKLYDYLIKQ